MNRKFQTIKSISLTLVIVIFILPFLYSKGLYERTLLIKDSQVREKLSPIVSEWHETMEKYDLTIVFSILRNSFLFLSEPPIVEIPEVIDPDAPSLKYSETKPLRVLLVGDSMAMILGYSFTQEFNKTEFLDYKVDAKAATSLSLPEYFNWPERFTKILSEKKYDLIIIHIGANDAQAIRTDGKYFKFESEEWKEIYRTRVREFITIAKSQNGKVYWIGLPPMQGSYYDKDKEILNSIAEPICLEENITFVSTIPILGDENLKYTKIKNYNGRPVIVRSEDGIHANGYGAILIRDAILGILKQDFIFETVKIDAAPEH